MNENGHGRSAGARPQGRPADQQFAAAARLFQAGRFDEAEHACRGVLALDRDHFDAHLMLGIIAARAGRHAAALADLERANALNANHPPCRFQLGMVLVALRRPDEAAEQFRRAVELDPNFFNALIALGNVLTQSDLPQEAAVQYRRALTLRPRDATSHYNLANVLMSLGQADDAIGHFQSALAIKPDSMSSLNNLALAFETQNRLDEAKATYRRALALDPDNREVISNLGHLHWRSGELDEALRQYERALALCPQSADSHVDIGRVLSRQGQYREALSFAEQGLRIDEDHTQAHMVINATVYAWSLVDRDAAVDRARTLLEAYGGKPLLRRGLSGLLGATIDEAWDGEYAKLLFDNFAVNFDATLTGLGYLDMPRALAKALALGEAKFDILDAGCGTGLCAPIFKPNARSLVGVDISPKMLARARAGGHYDRLVEADLVAFMAQDGALFDLIVSSDVVPYIGNLSRFLEAACKCLRAGGRAAISAENADMHGNTAGYEASPSGRYRHSRDYLETVFADSGFAVQTILPATMRREAGRDVGAWIVIGGKR